MAEKPILLWFRRDLRLADNAAMAAAANAGPPVIPVFILDEAAAGEWKPGAASRWWLHESLSALGSEIAKRGNRLILRRGATADILCELAKVTDAGAVLCSRAYEPWAAKLEREVRGRLAEAGLELKRYAGTLLHEPDQLTTQSGTPFKVYTPFWRKMSKGIDVPRPTPPPKHIEAPKKFPKSESLVSWSLLPQKPDWAGGFREAWSPGEDGACARLDAFIATSIANYTSERNRPDLESTSRLSPHLAFGEISPRQCWYAAKVAAAQNPRADGGCETFLKELAWREFSAHLLFHWPDLPSKPFRPEFAAFPWRRDAKAKRAWQKGQTGYPIVDAGMRELWTTGWMHNRVRMIVASFLIKDLLIPWQDGEAWFWDTLVDADLANNAASWQWVAGSGADAAPYFRIFNPVKQGETFDPDGIYVRRWVPEIADIPTRHIHAPWLAPVEILAKANVTIGKTYPAPIVDHGKARDAALVAFDGIKARA